MTSSWSSLLTIFVICAYFHLSRADLGTSDENGGYFGILTDPNAHCPDTVISNVTSGVIYSPSFPDDYPDNRECIYTITVPEGNIVRLVIYSLNLLNECCDNLRIYNGKEMKSSKLITKLHGVMDGPSTFKTTNSNVMTLNFLSDLQHHDKGFYARFDAVPGSSYDPKDVICPPTNYNETFGVIISPKWPNYYQNQASCHYQISAPKGRKIQLIVNYFETEREWDYLSVHDGETTKTQLLAKWSGVVQTDTTVTSSGSALSLFFLSNAAIQKQGFSITYLVV
ncbi:CUB domain-containing protein [Ditylenchus destructor]|nr:CUB domain-containing protein [Ditylenchus destructor]